MGKHILVVDDDALMRRSLAVRLGQTGYQVSTSSSAEEALLLARQQPPDAVLLDISLPNMDGLDAIREFRRFLQSPIIFVTARRESLAEVLGLELGADDYVIKPFDFDVLHARIKSCLRRVRPLGKPGPTSPILAVGDLRLNTVTRQVHLRGSPVDLTRREFDLLAALAAEPGRVVTINELIERVWGKDYVGEPQVIYVHVRWLREKVEANPNRPRRIVSVRGVGYRLDSVED
jgi:DNA-binding response OmpR family regulator